MVLGIVLVVLGIISFAYQGINYKTNKRVVDLGPIHADKTENHTIPLPPFWAVSRLWVELCS